MADFEKQFVQTYRLTTAEILYGFPDYPDLLQTYIWQDYDYVPKFPELKKFLDFWARELDGKIHSVYVASKKIVTAGEFHNQTNEIIIE